jgi:glycosyltransferase involved in cell wall biosynthesis
MRNGIAPLRVGWVFVGNEKVGSTRIHGLNIHRALLAHGVDSRVVVLPQEWSPSLRLSLWGQVKVALSDLDIVVFQKLTCPVSIRLARVLQLLRKKIVFVQCDHEPSPMVEFADLTVVTSRRLADHFQREYGKRAIFIDDAVEYDALQAKDHTQRSVLRLVWVGHANGWAGLNKIRALVENDASLSLTTISNHQDADLVWSQTTIESEILTHDVGVVPVDDSVYAVYKSTNRMTGFMALGLPVVVSPIPSYIDLVTRFGSSSPVGFVANSPADWATAFRLLSNAKERRRIGANARKVARAHYSIERIGRRWMMVFESLKIGLVNYENFVDQ